MNYAVLYQSKSGNTKKIADMIYGTLQTHNKVLYDVDQWDGLPDADVYFIGFAIHNMNCSIDIINILEQIPNKRIALFATCGYIPTDKYKENLEKKLSVWLPDEADYLGMFLCQGNVEAYQQKAMLERMSEQSEQLLNIFSEGRTHPNRDDGFMAADFAQTIQRKIEHSGNIPIW